MPQGKMQSSLHIGMKRTLSLNHLFYLFILIGRQARKEEGFDWSCQDETSL
jgi:hypothetical protein